MKTIRDIIEQIKPLSPEQQYNRQIRNGKIAIDLCHSYINALFDLANRLNKYVSYEDGHQRQEALQELIGMLQSAQITMSVCLISFERVIEASISVCSRKAIKDMNVHITELETSIQGVIGVYTEAEATLKMILASLGLPMDYSK